MWIQDVLIISIMFGKGSRRNRRPYEGEMFLTLADRSEILVVVIGMSNLCFGYMFLILEDYLYVPNVCRNLISTTYLGRHGYCVILKDNVVIKNDKVFI